MAGVSALLVMMTSGFSQDELRPTSALIGGFKRCSTDPPHISRPKRG